LRAAPEEGTDKPVNVTTSHVCIPSPSDGNHNVSMWSYRGFVFRSLIQIQVSTSGPDKLPEIKSSMRPDECQAPRNVKLNVRAVGFSSACP
jgi:hypothetical protein